MKIHYLSDGDYDYGRAVYGRAIVCRKSYSSIRKELRSYTLKINAVTCKKCLRAIIKKTAFLTDETSMKNFSDAVLTKRTIQENEFKSFLKRA